MDKLEGRTAIITGGGSGMGRATGVALARRGVNIVIADLGNCDPAVDEIAAFGGKAVGHQCDVSEDSTFEDLKKIALDNFGGVDIVMNNAGVTMRGLPEHVPLEEWQRIMNINFMSLIRSIHAFVPFFLERGEGHFVNTSSFSGLLTYSYDRLPYSASKAAMVQVSEGLAIYLGPKRIGVTVLCPGPVKTNILSSVRNFGPDTLMRGPGPAFRPLDPEEVGEQVVDAILTNRFMLPTDPQIYGLLERRVDDWDTFIQEQINNPFEGKLTEN